MHANKHTHTHTDARIHACNKNTHITLFKHFLKYRTIPVRVHIIYTANM